MSVDLQHGLRRFWRIWYRERRGRILQMLLRSSLRLCVKIRNCHQMARYGERSVVNKETLECLGSGVRRN